ncbi:ClpXP protease specificity-enhancing factor [Candidatus Halobeggiatoa sp. HSG11]|nr:ClpXP protease specificity-enhancing factor [Candidatus Halobeggiatoa sp. HSG11]
MTSIQPYLLRAFYDWIVDNSLTPHMLVNAEHKDVAVPQQYIENGQIILNVSPTAVQNLLLDNEWVSFSARFSGQPFSVYVPITAVLGIYAKENGKGMFFQDEKSEKPIPQPSQPKPTFKLVK